MKQSNVALFAASFLSLALSASSQAGGPATVRIQCTESAKDGTLVAQPIRVEVVHSADRVRAGVAYPTDATFPLGPVSVHERPDGSGTYDYGFALISKGGYEHCGNEYFYDNVGEWFSVQLDKAEQIISGDATFEKDVFVLHYDSRNPSQSTLETAHYRADTVFTTHIHGAYQRLYGSQPRPMSCTITTLN